MATHTNTITSVRRKLQITGTNELLTDTEIGDCIDEAVRKYSTHKPREVIDQIAGQAEYDYDVANYLASWVDDFSQIMKVEHPAENQTIELLEDEDWELYKPDPGTYTIDNASSGGTTITLSTATEALFFKDNNSIYIADDDANEINWTCGDGVPSTGVVTLKNALSNTYDATPFVSKRKVLRFLVDSPSTTEIIMVTYTAIHTLSDAIDTLPAHDYDAVVNIAASLCASEIASELAKQSDPSIMGDVIDHLDKSRRWSEIAKEYEEKYMDQLGITEESGVVGASAESEQDAVYAWGTDRLFHPRRWY